MQALVMLGGAAIGQGASAFASLEMQSSLSRRGKIRYNFTAVIVYLILMTSTTFLHLEQSLSFNYHGRARWSGPWHDPNMAGLLVGTGIVLAVGSAFSPKKSYLANETPVRLWWLRMVFFAICMTGMTFALINSYSRGAVLATLLGLTYLAIRRLKISDHVHGEHGTLKMEGSNESTRDLSIGERFSMTGGMWSLIIAVVFSLVSFLFWQFRRTDWEPARRAYSAVNAVDFSWRNRVAAWEGALQITTDHPWLGAGWNQPEQLYEHYYSSPKLTESTAVQSNDFLLLVATLGIPTFLCFGMYLWLSLTRRSQIGDRGSEVAEVDWLQTTYRAGAIVLLIGFWFDGGLFKLPTAATFWILLESGRRDAAAAKTRMEGGG